ncbi:MAG: transcription termination/antitermination protein NusG [Microvirga sp.]|jgi:transcriptional antiterminator RfaH
MWVAAQLLPQKEALALDQLKRSGFPTYLQRIRERRIVRRRVIETARPLFPSYAFISIESQWHAARWSPGGAHMIVDGAAPARVGDSIIAELRSREINGLVELSPGLKVGDRVRVERGPFSGLHGLYAGQAAAERVLILLAGRGGLPCRRRTSSACGPPDTAARPSRRAVLSRLIARSRRYGRQYGPSLERRPERPAKTVT